MKHLFITLLSVSCIALFAAVPEFLVVSDTPSRLEKIAESEIQLFYSQMYGKELKKINEKDAAGKSVIFLGNTAAAKKIGIDQSKCGKEEWVLKTVGDDLIISGGLPAGTLYGVYELLNRLGVVFATYNETYVPKKPDFPKFDEKRQPAVPGRLIYDGIPAAMLSVKADDGVKKEYSWWVLRSRINGEAVAPSVKSIYRGDYYNLSTYPYHNLGWYVDPNKYFATHPEYFQMDAGGRRIKPRSKSREGSLCMSNPKVAEITLETLRGFIKRDRAQSPKGEYPVIYDISELDATSYICRCPECRKITDAGNETDLLLTYINKIAREIRKEYPDIVIRTTNNWRAPGKLKPESNVFFRNAHAFAAISPFYPYDPVKAYKSRGATFQKNFDAWKKISDRLMLWDYWNLGNASYYTPPRVETVFDTIQPDLKFFLKNKITCMFYEATMCSVSPQNFIKVNYYVTNNLLIDPDMDVEKLADDFIRVYYGPAAPMMKKYFNLIRQGIKDSNQQNATSAGAGHWKYVTPEFLTAMYQDFHKTIKEVGPETRFAKRVRYELITPIWYAIANWNNYRTAFTKIGCSHKQLVDECRKLSYEFINRYKSKKPYVLEKNFEERFAEAITIHPRPEKFKDVPEENFRMITTSEFRNTPQLFGRKANDPESTIGKALVISDSRPGYHGVNILLPGKHGFRSTQFVLEGYPDKVSVCLKAVAQDEKYHWYRLPGNIVFSDKITFWGHGWSIQGRANRWYTLTYGDPRDNLWEQIWFSAKFTGPAYVKGSTQPNRIYIDKVVAVRKIKDNDFVAIPVYDTTKYAAGKLPSNWKGKGSVIKAEGKTLLEFASKKETVYYGPAFECTNKDTIIVKSISRGKGDIGIALYDKDGKILRRKLNFAPDNKLQNDYVFQISDLVTKSSAAQARVVIATKNSKITLEDFEVSIAKNLNFDTAQNDKKIIP